MQDRYAGDVGDFGKFSLLRSVFSNPDNKMGIAWYKFHDEVHNDDGRHVGYLNNQSYKRCDLRLVNMLSHVVNGERSISNLESLGLLPENTVYYSEVLDFHLTHKTQRKADIDFRSIRRSEWLDNAINSVKDCNVIFLDPDNGLETKSIPKPHQLKSGKYAYYFEVARFFENKKACIIYHHMNMGSAHESQIVQRSNELKEKIAKNGLVFAIRYKPYSPRAFFICATKSSSENIRQNIKDFLRSSCGIGWDTYYEV